MPRIAIELPEQFPFSFALAVRLTDLNYGGHVGNDRFLAFMQEARAAYFRSIGYGELDFGEGLGGIVADSAVVYRREVFAGTDLRIEVAPADLQRSAFDLIYRLSALPDGQEVARAKTGMVCFDYARKKVASLPEAFRQKLLA
jgi:YbgC/YbaW family acyl-CoA thioester hydrolase